MSKRTLATDVFDRLTHPEDPVEEPSKDETQSGAAEDEADTVDNDPHHQPASPAPTNRLRRRIIAVLIGVVVIAALGSAAYFGWRFKQLDDAADAGQAALAAARDYAVVLTTLDATDLDKHYAQALDGATGEFKDQYSQGSAQLRQILIDNKAAGNGVVLDAAVKSATKTKVEVLLFVDQSVTNAVNPGPRIDRNRVQMTMELIDNRWLASQVELI